MKIITKAELLKLPKGTIFRRIEPMMFMGEWMKFDGACGNADFFYSDVGPGNPQIVNDGFQITFNETGSRDGTFDGKDCYLILDEADIEAFVCQLTGEPYLPITYTIPEDFLK